MVARNADAVELGHVFGRVGKDVGNDAHRWFRGIDIRIAHHILFQDVVLDRTGKLFWAYSLLFGSNNIEGHNGDHGPIHCHRDRHLIERDAIEQNFHIEHRVDSNPCLADITNNPRMVRVVTAMSRQIKGNR